MLMQVKYENRAYGSDYPVKGFNLHICSAPQWMPNAVAVSIEYDKRAMGLSANSGYVLGGMLYLTRDHARAFAESILEYLDGSDAYLRKDL